MLTFPIEFWIGKVSFVLHQNLQNFSTSPTSLQGQLARRNRQVWTNFMVHVCLFNDDYKTVVVMQYQMQQQFRTMLKSAKQSSNIQFGQHCVQQEEHSLYQQIGLKFE
jgi:hypothetical protein